MPRNNGKCFIARPGDVESKWYVVDATDRVLGRLAVRLAMILMGKHKPTYTPHTLTGDHVIVINAEKVKLTGRKSETKTYQRYSFYPGGQKTIPIGVVRERHPERIIQLAVRRMLPRNKLGRKMLGMLKVYAGPKHEHQAQKPEALAV